MSKFMDGLRRLLGRAHKVQTGPVPRFAKYPPTGEAVRIGGSRQSLRDRIANRPPLIKWNRRPVRAVNTHLNAKGEDWRAA